jgi:hypothetical protein
LAKNSTQNYWQNNSPQSNKNSLITLTEKKRYDIHIGGFICQKIWKKKSKKFVAEISASKLFGDFHQQ